MSKSPFIRILAVGVLSCSVSVSGAISSAADDACAGSGHLSAPSHTAKYLEAFTSGGFTPSWDQGRLAKMGGQAAPDIVDVYDRDGKQVFQALIRFSGLSGMMVAQATPLTSGLLASGHAYAGPLYVNFIAKADDSGNVIRVIQTENFMPTRLCGQPDGTIWTYGRDLTKERNKEPYSLLRQYRLEGDLLHEYLPRDSVAIHTHGVPWGGGPSGTYLNCGAKQVSIYLNQSDEFVQVDTAKDRVQRWHMDMTGPKAKVSGLGVLSNGCIYAGLHAEEYEQSRAWGLYVLRLEEGKEMGRWVPVADTVHSQEWNEELVTNSFWSLRGAEGDELVIVRYSSGGAMEWVKVR